MKRPRFGEGKAEFFPNAMRGQTGGRLRYFPRFLGPKGCRGQGFDFASGRPASPASPLTLTLPEAS